LKTGGNLDAARAVGQRIAARAVAAGVEWGLLDARVRVSLPGGDTEVQWDGRGRPVVLRGPVARVFDGVIEL